jgi:hypothetical protein
LGGLFFLVNLLRGLDLLAGLERHFGLGAQLSPWALLELIARCLLSARDQALLADPIWTALARLDAREPRDPIAPDFAGRDRYLLPAKWTAHLPPAAALEVRFRADRVQFWRPEGFQLADAPAGEITALRPAGCRLARRARAAAVRPAGCDAKPAMRRFLSFLMPYIRARLVAFLGQDVVRALLLRNARLFVTGTHIDVMLDLHDATVAVRAAGLDANPGWAPQLGRILTFHYSQGGYR